MSGISVNRGRRSVGDHKLRRVRGRRRWPSICAAVVAAAGLVLSLPSVASANDSVGFRYGTDSNQPTILTPSSGPYVNSFHDPVDGVDTSLGGSYGAYYGRLGGYYTTLSTHYSESLCTNRNQNNSTNVTGANYNYADYEDYAKLSLKKYRPIAARNEDGKVFSGLL